MKIGKVLKDRMNLINITLKELAENTFIDIETIKGLLNDNVDFDVLSDCEKDLLAAELFCEPDFFVDEEKRKCDFIGVSMNRTKRDDSVKSKCKIYRFLNDYLFVKDLMGEENGKR